MAITGEALLDFGLTPADTATIVVSAPSISATSPVDCWIQSDSTVDHVVADHEWAREWILVTPTTPVAGVGFSIKGLCMLGYVTGAFKVRWVYV